MRFVTLPSLLLVVVVVLLPGEAHAKTLYAKKYKTVVNEDQYYWNNLAQEELSRTMNVKQNLGVAKNVIMFLGDGMSVPTITAARIYKGQKENRGGEEGSLTFETFPHVGLSKTYNVNKQVSDSASTATAYLTGVKTNYKTIGVDGTARYKDCSSVNEKNKVSSIVKWSQDAGKRTGVVTSTRVTHATPAGTYAHVADRDWECDGAIPKEAIKLCGNKVKDIARQLVEDEPGHSLNVVMGGGYQNLDAFAVGTPDDPLDTQWANCTRTDKRNLVQTWMNKKKSDGVTWAFARNKTAMLEVDTTNVEFFMGLFANGHLPYEFEKIQKKLDVPTLAEMTETAINILKQEPKGFFLLVEGGRIDHAHHDTVAHRALDETVAMDRAVEMALKLTSQEDTLIIVTADHAHTMSISGYPERGQEIIGLAALDNVGLPYTTLMYANGPGYNYSVGSGKNNNNQVVRPNVTREMVEKWDYTQLAAVPMNSETHGGDDVPIYALGPMAHLFHTLHEQNYIAHVMAYASCVGSNRHHCTPSSSSATQTASLITILLPFLFTQWLHY
ncbi:alkaline phosphatase-like [Homarus americanus]|uniref:alkaline phosphatase-like n=1 Tax=Homarus americanus TaxID=6706 RepID=UPI001C4491CD|nr:alkaline phosphatase-like [Homarus americanus]